MRVVLKRLCVFVLAGVVFFDALFGGNSLSGLDNNIRADISFCIVDLKFDGQPGSMFKVCEFGESRISAFKGLDEFYWGKFWRYLKRKFNLPIWYVGRYYMPEKFKEMRAYNALIKNGGQVLTFLNQLERNPKFKSLVGDRKIGDHSKISQYKAIICTASMDKQVKDFQKKYPNVLVLDLATADFVNSKIKTVKLLDDDEFRNYCPKFKVLKRIKQVDPLAYAGYVHKTAQEILKEFNCDCYVIKPIADTMGRGVSIIPKDELGDALYSVLSLTAGKQGKIAGKKIDRFAKYWQKNRNNTCLIEEFAHSKIISVEDKLYDPTMRLIFILCYDNHVPKIEILGGYWKIPNVALNDVLGDFTVKHKSGTSHETKANIDPKDYRIVTSQFKDFMLHVYLKMLGKY
ncbi:MAG: hypothetical protein ABH827_02065 [bacterium]